MNRTRNTSTQYLRLEQRLVLLTWLNDLLGYKSNRDLLADTKEATEGFDALGHSYIYYRLKARGNRVKVPLADLARYDDNIQKYLQTINALRPKPITLRYFQYLAVLYTEIFLDWYFHYREKLLRSLNKFVMESNRKLTSDLRDPKFRENDLKKLAFWMATGSGKTLIMHINYWQFLSYNNLPLDNILLITPNEGLSKQHIAEMEASGIPCQRFDLNESSLRSGGRNIVRVIEITKLVGEKRGSGVSVPVEAFEGNNLIFIDEGHKGSGGQKWRSYRDAIGRTGFTFEYSATFGQALTAAKNDQLTAEYGKSIIFDYSYHYFYSDGYGKDFYVLNLKEKTTESKTETLLLGNMLSFYEQQCVFENKADALKPYNLERPLWIFAGSSVNAVYRKNKRRHSDVLTVIRFLHHFLQNKHGWADKSILNILAGNSGLITPYNQDVFEDKFMYLRNAGMNARDIYLDILAKTFHVSASGKLHLCDMRGHSGEMGLKASGAQRYFGLIYIGDTNMFKKLVEDDDSGIILEEDAVTYSLFSDISKPETSINILIGAKKFMEGWNSWRVSNMGLLNIGKREGSMIIQLFGRGVRLKGKDLSLKRSSMLDGDHPKYLHILETLNIFAVRANYMSQFRDYLEKEGIDTEGNITMPLNIKINNEFLNKGLVVPRIPQKLDFGGKDILLKPDESIRVKIDMSLKIQKITGIGANGVTVTEVKGGKEQAISEKTFTLIDWEQAYLNLLEYKRQKDMTNLVITPHALKGILTTTEPWRLYSLIADKSLIKPESFADVPLIQDTVHLILRKYVERFYQVHRERWESKNMKYNMLDKSDPNFQDYTIKIARSEKTLITAIRKLIKEGKRIYSEDTRDLPNVHFERHLYQPLLVEQGGKVKSEPPGLKESERQFVEDMREYCRTEIDRSLAGKEVYLLRNLTRGKGIKFFYSKGFYPDFILWIKDTSVQNIIFIEPHGMIYADAYQYDDKARLHETLPELAKKIGSRTGVKNVNLDSYIVSATPFENLRNKYGDGTWDKRCFAEHHILFSERNDEYDYIAYIFRS